MSVLDQYTFTRSLSVLSSPSLASLLSCSLCSQPLSSTTALSSGKCPHAICQDCLSFHPGGSCPVSGCNIPAHTKDYQENRTLGQLARCLGNIKTLLENKVVVEDETKEGGNEAEPKISEDVKKSSAKTVTTPLKTVQHNQTDTKKKVASSKTDNKKVAAAKLKENKAAAATPEQGAAKTRNNKTVNKEPNNKKEGDDIVVPKQPEIKKTTTEKRNSRTTKAENIAKAGNSVSDKANVKTVDGENPKEKGASEKPVDNKAIKDNPSIKKPSRLSLPDGKKTKKGRVRAATTSGQPVATMNSTLNQSTSTGVSSLEKKNKKGETPLHAACAKGCLSSVQSLLTQGASPNTQDHAGWTPLHEAATGGRLDLARLLLEAGARPSVPSKEDRVTALHDAVGSGQVELVRLLVSKGADRDARDSKGNTPRDMAVSLGAKVGEAIEDTVVEVQEEHIMETILEPQNMVLCLGKKVADNTKLVKMLVETAASMGCRKPSTQLSEEMTHLLVEEEEEDSLYFLTALVVGAEIVSTSWLLESGTQGKLVSCLKFRCEGKGEEGANKARVRRASKQPGLLAGLHFYLTGVFDPPCLTKGEVQNIVRMAGGKLITREPDPEFIPSQEATVPHHARTSSSMASTSHVILYMAGSKREPMMKYNMKHVKTLPVSWLVSCISSGSVMDPH